MDRPIKHRIDLLDKAKQLPKLHLYQMNEEDLTIKNVSYGNILNWGGLGPAVAPTLLQFYSFKGNKAL